MERPSCRWCGSGKHESDDCYVRQKLQDLEDGHDVEFNIIDTTGLIPSTGRGIFRKAKDTEEE
jgi:hypothetical protein